jgi:ElaB/YqjD/DUF883 family membrane-anchored ribosome-binding protein
MPWVKVDDHFDEHPKFAQASPLGIALWLAGLAYCNRNLTDGFIPWSVARSLLSWEFLQPHPETGKELVYTIDYGTGMRGDRVTCPFVADMLVDAGLWEEAPGGYRVHDFAVYQPSREEVLAEREKTRSRVEKYRNARRNAASNPVGNASSNAVSNGGVTPLPVPVPVPERSSKEALSNARDPVETYHLLTGRPPKKATISWLDELVKDYGAEAVCRTMATVWTGKADLGSFIGDVQAVLVLEERRASQEAEAARRKADAEFQRQERERIANASPEEKARAAEISAGIKAFVGGLPR